MWPISVIMRATSDAAFNVYRFKRLLSKTGGHKTKALQEFANKLTTKEAFGTAFTNKTTTRTGTNNGQILYRNVPTVFFIFNRFEICDVL